MRMLGWILGGLGGGIAGFLLSAVMLALLSRAPAWLLFWANPSPVANPTGQVGLLDLLSIPVATVFGFVAGGKALADRFDDWQASK